MGAVRLRLPAARWWRARDRVPHVRDVPAREVRELVAGVDGLRGCRKCQSGSCGPADRDARSSKLTAMTERAPRPLGARVTGRWPSSQAAEPVAPDDLPPPASS